jgi:hypothetical protein
MTEGGGDRGGPWSPPKIRKKIIKSKKNKNKNKNVKFGSNFSHMVPSQIFFGLILNFLSYTN